MKYHRQENSALTLMINYINNHEIGFKFTVKEAFQEIGKRSLASVNNYSKSFCIIGILNKVRTKMPMQYEIVHHIPEKINSITLNSLVIERLCRPSWKDWFIEVKERIEREYDMKYK